MEPSCHGQRSDIGELHAKKKNSESFLRKQESRTEPDGRVWTPACAGVTNRFLSEARAETEKLATTKKEKVIPA